MLKSFLLNKRGAEAGDNLMFLSIMVIFVIVGGAIVAGVFIFFGNGYDSRQADSAVLNSKIYECILENSELNQDNFYLKCGFDKSAFEGGKYSVGVLKNEKGIFVFNNPEQCLLTGTKSRYYAICTINEFSHKGDSYKIITGSSEGARGIQ